MAIDIVNPYDMAIAQFDEAADLLGLSQAMRAILRKPKCELIVNFPVRMDNGDVEMFTGYRVHFFFQAEDGIRGADVTGVQTCALPISRVARAAEQRGRRRPH